jgi:hypothetical protein
MNKLLANGSTSDDRNSGITETVHKTAEGEIITLTGTKTSFAHTFSHHTSSSHVSACSEVVLPTEAPPSLLAEVEFTPALAVLADIVKAEVDVDGNGKQSAVPPAGHSQPLRQGLQ